MPPVFSPLAFHQPWWLLALPPLAFLAVWLGRGTALPDARQRILAIFLRVLIFSCVVFALAGTECVQTSRKQTVIFVADGSYSVGEKGRSAARKVIVGTHESLRGGDRLGVVSVGGDVALTVSPDEKRAVTLPEKLPEPPEPMTTNLARGINRALASLPDDTAGRIVVLSDGNENAGQALEAARGAKSAGVPVDVLVLGNNKKDTPETLVERMDAPNATRRGEPFRLSVAVNSRTGGDGALTVYRNGKEWRTQRVTLSPGKNVLSVNDRGGEPGFYTYEARLSLSKSADTVAENNRAVGFVRVTGEPRVLVIRDPASGDASDTASLVKTLRGQKLFVTEGGPEMIPATGPAPLLAYDGIILTNTPADAFDKAQMSAIQSAVRDLGIGLVMVGGEYGYAAGGWLGTPVEAALPVEMESKKQKRYPAVALALAVDVSGSMDSPPQSGGSSSKMELAQEAAHRAVDALAGQDNVGVIGVDTSATTIVGLTPATKKGSVHSGISELGGGGGTDMAAGVEACYDMLKGAKLPVKHAILITDGETPPHDYAQMIADYKKRNMTFTLVVIDEGQSADSLEPLKRVASQTGGRYYFVKDAAELPKIYTREVRTIRKPPLIEEPFAPKLGPNGATHPLLEGVGIDTSPPLLGYDVAFAKPTAESILLTHRDDPLLSAWQYGLGKSVAWTSDAAPRWSAGWLSWNGFAPFWAQTVRYTLKSPQNSGADGFLTVRVVREGGKARLVADAVDIESGSFVNNLQLRARIAKPNGDSETVPLPQTGPGRYEAATFDAGQVGSYTASVLYRGTDGAERAVPVGFAVAYSPEFAVLAPNTALLARIADVSGGRVLKDGKDVLKIRGAKRVPTPLALPLLTLALFLLPLDVANRRLSLWRTRETAQAAVEQVQQTIVLKQEERKEAVRAAEVQAFTQSQTRIQERKVRFKAMEGDED